MASLEYIDATRLSVYIGRLADLIMTFLHRYSLVGAPCALRVYRFKLSLLRPSHRLTAYLNITRSMSAVSKLHSSLKELVTSATEDGSSDFGKNEKDKAEVNEWIEKIAVGEVAKPDNLKVMLKV